MYSKEIGLRAQKMLTILGSIGTIFGVTYMTTWIMNKISYLWSKIHEDSGFGLYVDLLTMSYK